MIEVVKPANHEALPQAGEAVSVGEGLNRFIQHNRKPIMFGALGMLVFLVGFIVAVSIRDRLQERSFRQLADFNQRYEVLRVMAT